MTKAEEQHLERLAKRLLAMPHKPREESKIGKKSKAKKAQSPAKGKGKPERAT